MLHNVSGDADGPDRAGVVAHGDGLPGGIDRLDGRLAFDDFPGNEALAAAAAAAGEELFADAKPAKATRPIGASRGRSEAPARKGMSILHRCFESAMTQKTDPCKAVNVAEPGV